MVGDLAISIHALREESDKHHKAVTTCQEISIHALREESDLTDGSENNTGKISIHALREESDSIRHAKSPQPENFNPRSP